MQSMALRGIVLALTVIFSAVSATLNLPKPETPAAAQYLDEPISPQSTAPVMVTILQRLEDTSFSLQQVCDLYSEEDPDNARFLIRTVAGSGYEAALKATLLAGEGADLFQIDSARELLAFRENINPLGLAWAGSAAANVVEAVTLDGQVYALPYSLEGLGFIVNRDIFEAAGVELPSAGMPALIPELRTIEMLGEKFANLREAIQSGKLKEDFPALEAVAEFPTEDWDFISGGLLDILVSDAKLGAQNMFFPAAKDTEELIKLMARYSSSSGNWAGLTKVSYSEQTERLANGQIAVMLADTDIYKQVNAINPEMQGRLRLLPVPLEIYEQPSAYIFAKCYWAINASAEPQSAKAARGLLTWLYRSPQGTEALAETLGALSPYRETAKPTGAALHTHLLSCIDAGLYLPRYSRELDPTWRKNIFFPAVQSYFTEPTKTWTQALTDAGVFSEG